MASTNAQQEISKFASILNDRALFETNVADMATISEFHSNDNTADIVSMIDDEGGDDEAAKVLGCPVMWSCFLDFDDEKHPIYREPKAGDVVLVVFTNRNLDNFNGKSSYKKMNERMHSINDAVVVGRYKLP